MAEQAPAPAAPQGPQGQQGPEPGKGIPAASESKAPPEPTYAVTIDGEEKQVPASVLMSLKHKLKVNGKEEEYELSDIMKKASEAEGANKKFEKAAKMLKDAEMKSLNSEKVLAAMKADPKSFIKQMNNLGIDYKTVIEDLLWEEIEQSKLSPEEKAWREKERKLKHYEEQEMTQKQRAEEIRKRAAVQKEMVNLAKDVTAAIKEAGLPGDKETIMRTMYWMKEAQKRGGTVTAKQAVSLAKQQRDQELANFLKSASTNPELIDSLVPSELRELIRKRDLESFKKGGPPKEVHNSNNGTKKKGPITMEEWKKQLIGQ